MIKKTLSAIAISAIAAACGGSPLMLNYEATVKAAAPAEPTPEPVVRKLEIEDKIQFRRNRAGVRKNSFPTLNRVAAILAANPNVRIEIQGHTDASGADEENRRLSQQRAETVRKYLVAQGTSAERLSAVGHGEEQPIADNNSEEGRYQNRRVDFVIVDGHVASN